jgi:hypothetical protein
MEEKTRAKHSVLPKATVVKGKREEGECGDKRRKNTGAKHSVLPKTSTVIGMGECENGKKNEEKNGSKAFGSPEGYGR